MGLDFITAKAKGFRKLWDGGRTALATPDLLSPEEQWEEQHVRRRVRLPLALRLRAQRQEVQRCVPARSPYLRRAGQRGRGLGPERRAALCGAC